MEKWENSSEVIVAIPRSLPLPNHPDPVNAHPLHHLRTVAAASHTGRTILINCKGCWSDQKRPGLRLHVDETKMRAACASLM